MFEYVWRHIQKHWIRNKHFCELLLFILDVVVYSSGGPEVCGVCVKDVSVCHGDGCQHDIC